MKLYSDEDVRNELRDLLIKKSVSYGDFTLSSGAKSKYYLDCRLTTMDPGGAWLVGQLVFHQVRQIMTGRSTGIDGVGGLTLGADPMAMATGMVSVWSPDRYPLAVFSVRKQLKMHGKGKLIEGNFKPGHHVVILEDVITTGESALMAANAVKSEGGVVVAVIALVDRQEGGRENIINAGIPVISIFKRDDLVSC